MAFFKGFRVFLRRSVNVDDVYVVTAIVLSGVNDGGGVRRVTMYFLATAEGGNYYELFSGTKLERKNYMHDGCKTDTPYVQFVESYRMYRKDCRQTRVSLKELFNFITGLNVLSKLGAMGEKVE